MTTDGLNALKLAVMLHEGYSPVMYTDTVGKSTIGYGRNLTDCGISKAEADVLLENDINTCLYDLARFPWFAGLNEARQIAVTDWRYNLGPVGFREFAESHGYLERGDFQGFGEHFRQNHKYFSQVGARAEWIAHVIETGKL